MLQHNNVEKEILSSSILKMTHCPCARTKIEGLLGRLDQKVEAAT